MESLSFLLFLSALVGAAIGFERESRGDVDRPGQVGGIRTFALVSLLGGLAGYCYSTQLWWIAGFLSVFLAAFVLIYYIMGASITKHTGITNELSVLYTFVIGFLLTSQLLPTQLVIALLVVVLLILSLKHETKELMKGVSNHEIEAFISYAIIALVILPFLPNQSITLAQIPYLSQLLEGYNISLGQWAGLELLNAQKVWFVVVLITGIDVVGHILGRIVGQKRSFGVASFVGGFISSTSTTQSLAQKSKSTGMVNGLVGAAILANLASFFQIFLLVGPLNRQWLVALTPTLFCIIIAALIMTVIFWKMPEKKTGKKLAQQEEDSQEKKVFALMPALKFAALLIIVKLVTKICLIVFGQSGFIVSSVIASLAGIDAVMVNLADLSGGLITMQMATITFVLVNATNLLSKSVYAFLQGNRGFALKFFLAVLVIIAASLVGIFFV
ncbi:MAG: MgtC/SapB family protein [Candidatus Magasanikbacteria bacterium]|nr:MgtC/SapB family protein [Candidatus Magasanikbacteria bacterium]